MNSMYIYIVVSSQWGKEHNQDKQPFTDRKKALDCAAYETVGGFYGRVTVTQFESNGDGTYTECGLIYDWEDETHFKVT